MAYEALRRFPTAVESEGCQVDRSGYLYLLVPWQTTSIPSSRPTDVRPSYAVAGTRGTPQIWQLLYTWGGDSWAQFLSRTYSRTKLLEASRERGRSDGRRTCQRHVMSLSVGFTFPRRILVHVHVHHYHPISSIVKEPSLSMPTMCV